MPTDRLRRAARAVLACLALAVPPGLAVAEEAAPIPPLCHGENLIAGLDPETRAALDTATDAVPFSRGLLWRAERDGQRIAILGTYHFADPRHAPILEWVTPALTGASKLLVEAGPEEEAALEAAIAADPELLFIDTGATMPERLPEAAWQEVAAQMRARGIPPFVAAKFRPWYLAAMLSMSPCVMAEVAAGAVGLDGQLIGRARDAGVPIGALEAHDTILRVFEGLTEEEEIDLISSSLAAAAHADDYTATLADAYFAGETWLIWEFTRVDSLENSGLPPERLDAQFRLAETVLMEQRNRAWLPVILAALEELEADSGEPEPASDEAQARPADLVVAVGALHLPGEAGILNLLDAEGFTLTPLPLPDLTLPDAAGAGPAASAPSDPAAVE